MTRCADRASCNSLAHRATRDALILCRIPAKPDRFLERLDGRARPRAPLRRPPSTATRLFCALRPRPPSRRAWPTGGACCMSKADPATGLLELRIHAFLAGNGATDRTRAAGRKPYAPERSSMPMHAPARPAQAEAELAAARERLGAARAAADGVFGRKAESSIPVPISRGARASLRHLQGQLAQALVEQDIAGMGVTEAAAQRRPARQDRGGTHPSRPGAGGRRVSIIPRSWPCMNA